MPVLHIDVEFIRNMVYVGYKIGGMMWGQSQERVPYRGNSFYSDGVHLDIPDDGMPLATTHIQNLTIYGQVVDKIVVNTKRKYIVKKK